MATEIAAAHRATTSVRTARREYRRALADLRSARAFEERAYGCPAYAEAVAARQECERDVKSAREAYVAAGRR